MVLKLVECTDYKQEYGLLIVDNPNVTRDEIQEKIYEFKHSYKAYGYNSMREVKDDGYATVDEMMQHESQTWDVARLVAHAFPKAWKVRLCNIDATVEC